jgi:hypothetical protein
MANRMEEEFPPIHWQAGLPLERGGRLPPVAAASLRSPITGGRYAVDLLARQSRSPGRMAQLAYAIGIETLIKRYFSNSRSFGISVRPRSPT